MMKCGAIMSCGLLRYIAMHCVVLSAVEVSLPNVSLSKQACRDEVNNRGYGLKVMVEF
jgi:hypothetical protein